MDYLLPHTPRHNVTAEMPHPSPRRLGSVKLFPLLAALLTLAGCSLTPTYQPPTVDTPTAFKEAAAEGQWKTAEPAENIPRGEWWKTFADPVLDDQIGRAHV